MQRVLVIHPPTSVARDFIDYPYFANLGAVQLAACLRERFEVALVDSYALQTSSLTWREDGRAHLGALVDEVLAASDHAQSQGAPFDAVVVAYTPFHRPPARCDVLGPTIEGLKGICRGAPLLLADCYQ